MSLLFGSVAYTQPNNNDAEVLSAMYHAVKDFPQQKKDLVLHQNAHFGHILTYNTPESLYEKLPVYLPGEKILFTAQARIDNRAELARQLSSPDNEQTTDGNLILKAYLHWGKDCVKYLRGNWSFAVFDYQEQELFIARDQTGYTALYYYQDETGFYFSSGIKSLLSLPSYHKELNELHFVRNLTLWDDSKTSDETFYKNIFTLPLAHTLTLKNKNIRLQRYWHPENIPITKHKNHQDYVVEMMEVFTRAVNARLRSQQPVASMLSGGLDSSSVTIIASELLKQQNKTLTTFSHIPLFVKELMADKENESRILDETPLIREVANAAGNIHPVFLNSADYSVIKGMRDWIEISSKPVHASVNLYWLLDIYNQTAHQGYGALLSGEGGNGSISFNGLDYLLPYRFTTFIRHPYLFLRQQIAKPIAHKYFSNLLLKRRNATSNLVKYVSNIFCHPAILNKYDIIQDINRGHKNLIVYHKDVRELKKMFIELYKPRSISGAACAHHFGFELRDPTADVEIIEYFFTIPNEVFFDEHYNIRMLIKRMMKGKIPDKVLFEKRKGLQSADIAYRVKAQEAEISATIDAVLKSPAANHYIDLPGLNATWQQYKKQPYVDPYSYQRLLKALHFAMFLQMHFD